MKLGSTGHGVAGVYLLAENGLVNSSVSRFTPLLVDPLSPNTHIQILHSDLHIFSLRMCWENLIKDQGIFSLVIILLILITFSLGYVLVLLGENWCWSQLGGGGYSLTKGYWGCAAGWGRIFTTGGTIMDYNGAAFSTELLEWGPKFSDFWGK